MNNYKLTILSDIEFDGISKSFECSNFFQSIYMKDVLTKEGKKVYLLGLKDIQSNIVCATLLCETSNFLSYKTYEALKGYLIDYNNLELVKIFTNKLVEFVKKRRGYQLIIDPYIPLIERNINGDVVPFKRNNTHIKKYLLNLGFKEIIGSQVKWTFVLDTNKSYKEIYNNFKSNTKNIINKTINNYHLTCEELTYDNLYILKNITFMTCIKKDFKDKSLKYYQDMYKSFKNNIKVIACKLNVKSYLKELYTKLDNLNKNYYSTNNINKKNNINKDIILISNKIDELKGIKDEYIYLAASMFILYNREITYLFSGSNPKYMKYYGQYNIQNEIIKYACNNNYKRYNFFGIDKNFKRDGVYEFKKGFNGYVEELLGTYSLKVNFIYYVHYLLSLVKKYYKK